MTRQDNVLNMQITLVSIMADIWKISFKRLSFILEKYNVLEYIDVCYEYFNSMGEYGILDELKCFIEEQGGDIH